MSGWGLEPRYLCVCGGGWVGGGGFAIEMSFAQTEQTNLHSFIYIYIERERWNGPDLPRQF